MEALAENFDLILRGFLYTLGLSVLGGLGALILGTILAAFRVSPIPTLRGLGATYVEIARNTPLTVVFFFLAFGLPQVGITFTNFFLVGVIALALYTASFVCEAIRSGVNSISRGQAEAARAMGLTFGQSLRLVILPQAFRTVVPPLGNVWIALVKNSSIAAGFGVAELTSLVNRLSNEYPSDVLVIFLGIAVCYMIITIPSGLLVGQLERKAAILR